MGSEARRHRPVARIFSGWRGLLAALLLLLGAGTPAWGQSYGVYRQVYTGLISSSLLGLTNDSSFPDFPTFTEVLTNEFTTPLQYGDYYGQRLRALVVPPVSGTYVFWIAADDTGQLLLSTDESPANKQLIGMVTNTVTYGTYFNHPSQQSPSIYLEAGKRYYIEALQSAGLGYDFLNVGWKLPDGTMELPMPATRLLPFGAAPSTQPVLLRQPSSTTVLENAPASFHVEVANLDAVGYQWQRDGGVLSGITGATYTLSAVTTNDNGARFRCVVSNIFGVQTSSEAILTVLPDTIAPVFSSAANLTTNTVQVLFSEPVELNTATNAANYTLNNGATVSKAVMGATTREVRLTTSPLVRGTAYLLTVKNVRDRAAARNAIAANSPWTFTVQLKGIYREIFTGVASRFVSDLTNSPAYPNSPTSVELLTNAFETPGWLLNNYGQRLRARLLPPVTGDYTFWIAADDTGILLLGTNENPASARQIASVIADTYCVLAAMGLATQPKVRGHSLGRRPAILPRGLVAIRRFRRVPTRPFGGALAIA